MLAHVKASRSNTVEAYLDELPEDRRSALTRVRSVIRKHLPRGFEETMQYGMISYVIPLSRYPETYNGQALTLASLGSQKNHMAVYLMGVFGSPELQAWFEAAYKKSGKKLDAGKSCVRFKKLDDLALDAVAGAIERVSVADLIGMSEAAHGGKRPAAKKAAKKVSVPKTKTPAKA
ncbi:MAG TPA: DUF1801 domain-containing protein, partial [Polyangiales bacterium]|nr:DUF1801 domain-containing protein [Polyangiales bacterium]